jgi:hypothetical protein
VKKEYGLLALFVLVIFGLNHFPAQSDFSLIITFYSLAFGLYILLFRMLNSNRFTVKELIATGIIASGMDH